MRHDVVYYWIGGTEVGRWNRADPGTRDDIRRQGYVAHNGSLAIGPPEGPPSKKEIDEVLSR